MPIGYVLVGVTALRVSGGKFESKVKLTPARLTHARKLIEQGTTPTDAATIIGIGRAIRCSARPLEGMREIARAYNAGMAMVSRLAA
jgi:hypothetical protein